MSNILDTEIKYLPGVGPKRAELLGKELSIFTFRDLVYTFPFRYIDRSKVYSISEIEPTSAYVQIRGKVINKAMEGSGRGKRLIVSVRDSTGSVELIFFKGIKWINDKIKPNAEYIIFGRPSMFKNTINFVHPEIETVSEASSTMYSSMIGVYSSNERLKSSGIGIKFFTKFIYTFLSKYSDAISETLPEYILQQNHLCSLNIALRNIHFPSDIKALEEAQKRLKFEELFYLQLSLLKNKNIRENNSVGNVFHVVGDYFNKCYKNIPYELTGAQKRVIKEIRKDMRSGRQMNRLLQGDVGSGKTLVAILSAMIAADNGFQTCIMAPTEVLANQHYNGVFKFIKNTGIKVALLTGSIKTKQRRIIDEGLRDGSINILFGTHAVIEDKVVFKNLGFVVIDEQHRFGVNQRAKLRLKANIVPHVLVMTATPIPRTLSMTVYGDLDVSVLDELPPGRKPVQTINTTDKQRDSMFSFLKKEIDQGRQVFIVYPLIKESETMDYKNLQEGYEEIIKQFPAPKYVTAVVHGQQKSEDKDYDMKLFAEGKANILVATSVIEVGVDVPNASVMVIESAERFGLSQLHQLRGRVGRGADKSYCILVTGYKMSKESRQRIELMCQTSDGFEIAEADLKLRGPGDLEGTQQSGIAFDLKIADIARDGQLLQYVREVAQKVIDIDPNGTLPENEILWRQLKALRKTNVNWAAIS